MNLELVLFRNYSATKRPSTLCNDAKFFIQVVWSRTGYVISSLITEAITTSFLELL